MYVLIKIIVDCQSGLDVFQQIDLESEFFILSLPKYIMLVNYLI